MYPRRPSAGNSFSSGCTWFLGMSLARATCEGLSLGGGLLLTSIKSVEIEVAAASPTTDGHKLTAWTIRGGITQLLPEEYRSALFPDAERGIRVVPACRGGAARVFLDFSGASSTALATKACETFNPRQAHWGPNSSSVTLRASLVDAKDFCERMLASSAGELRRVKGSRADTLILQDLPYKWFNLASTGREVLTIDHGTPLWDAMDAMTAIAQGASSESVSASAPQPRVRRIEVLPSIAPSDSADAAEIVGPLSFDAYVKFCDVPTAHAVARFICGRVITLTGAAFVCHPRVRIDTSGYLSDSAVAARDAAREASAKHARETAAAFEAHAVFLSDYKSGNSALLAHISDTSRGSAEALRQAVEVLVVKLTATDARIREHFATLNEATAAGAEEPDGIESSRSSASENTVAHDPVDKNVDAQGFHDKSRYRRLHGRNFPHPLLGDSADEPKRHGGRRWLQKENDNFKDAGMDDGTSTASKSEDRDVGSSSVYHGLARSISGVDIEGFNVFHASANRLEEAHGKLYRTACEAMDAYAKWATARLPLPASAVRPDGVPSAEEAAAAAKLAATALRNAMIECSLAAVSCEQATAGMVRILANFHLSVMENLLRSLTTHVDRADRKPGGPRGAGSVYLTASLGSMLQLVEGAALRHVVGGARGTEGPAEPASHASPASSASPSVSRDANSDRAFFVAGIADRLSPLLLLYNRALDGLEAEAADFLEERGERSTGSGLGTDASRDTAVYRSALARNAPGALPSTRLQARGKGAKRERSLSPIQTASYKRAKLGEQPVAPSASGSSAGPLTGAPASQSNRSDGLLTIERWRGIVSEPLARMRSLATMAGELVQTFLAWSARVDRIDDIFAPIMRRLAYERQVSEYTARLNRLAPCLIRCADHASMLPVRVPHSLTRPANPGTAAIPQLYQLVGTLVAVDKPQPLLNALISATALRFVSAAEAILTARALPSAGARALLTGSDTAGASSAGLEPRLSAAQLTAQSVALSTGVLEGYPAGCTLATLWEDARASLYARAPAASASPDAPVDSCTQSASERIETALFELQSHSHALDRLMRAVGIVRARDGPEALKEHPRKSLPTDSLARLVSRCPTRLPGPEDTQDPAIRESVARAAAAEAELSAEFDAAAPLDLADVERRASEASTAGIDAFARLGASSWLAALSDRAAALDGPLADLLERHAHVAASSASSSSAPPTSSGTSVSDGDLPHSVSGVVTVLAAALPEARSRVKAVAARSLGKPLEDLARQVHQCDSALAAVELAISLAPEVDELLKKRRVVAKQVRDAVGTFERLRDSVRASSSAAAAASQPGQRSGGLASGELRAHASDDEHSVTAISDQVDVLVGGLAKADAALSGLVKSLSDPTGVDAQLSLAKPTAAFTRVADLLSLVRDSCATLTQVRADRRKAAMKAAVDRLGQA